MVDLICQRITAGKFWKRSVRERSHPWFIHSFQTTAMFPIYVLVSKTIEKVIANQLIYNLNEAFSVCLQAIPHHRNISFARMTIDYHATVIPLLLDHASLCSFWPLWCFANESAVEFMSSRYHELSWLQFHAVRYPLMTEFPQVMFFNVMFQ